MTHTFIYPQSTRHTAAGHLEIGAATSSRRASRSTSPGAGAYGHATADNHNGQPRAAVVFVSDGAARVVIERDAWEGVVRLQRPLAALAYTL